MAKRIAPVDGMVPELRQHLVARCRAALTRREAAPYDFSADVTRLRQRLDALLAGVDVTPIYRHEIPRELQPPRTAEGAIVYTLRGDVLVGADYDRVRTV